MVGSLGGGRPKADIWKHVIILNEKQVKCKYCGHAFAKSANRIKSHVSQTQGKGVRVCPQFSQPNTDSSKRLKIKTSFGSPSPRDDTKYNEKMLDCRMSTKTILREGMTQQPRMKLVGPFAVFSMMDARDLRLIEYVFDPSQAQSEIVFSSTNSFLTRKEFTTLEPQSLLDSMIINIFADYFTDIERKKRSSNLNWYLPITFSTSALTSDGNSFLSFVKEQRMREKYMSKLVDCEKIFIPVHTDISCGHFYLYVIHLKTKQIEIWDSSPFVTNEEYRKTTHKLLFAFTILFVDELWDSHDTFLNFQMTIADDTPLQPNEYDCGIFVINFMQQSTNATINNSPQSFHSDEERLDLALKLLKSDLNEIKETLYEKAMDPESTNTYSNKRLKSNTSSGNLQENLGDLQGSPRPRDDTKFTMPSNSLTISNESPVQYPFNSIESFQQGDGYGLYLADDMDFWYDIFSRSGD